MPTICIGLNLDPDWVAGYQVDNGFFREIQANGDNRIPTPQQLILSFVDQRKFLPTGVIPSPANQLARMWLKKGRCYQDWPDSRLSIWGKERVGKTHLIKNWAFQHRATILHSDSLNNGCTTVVQMLTAMSMQNRAIAVDDADKVNDPACLLHFINWIRENKNALLLSGRVSPEKWHNAPPDLVSRLRATVAVEVHPPDMILLRRLLLQLLVERHISISQSCIDWILLRVPKTIAAVQMIVRQLDIMTLTKRQMVTRTMARNILKMLKEKE